MSSIFVTFPAAQLRTVVAVVGIQT